MCCISRKEIRKNGEREAEREIWVYGLVMVVKV